MKTKTQASAPHFDLLTLHLVLAVKATGSVARAAETMHLTASAVSKRILELEHQLGTAILERHSQGAITLLTRRGQIGFQKKRALGCAASHDDAGQTKLIRKSIHRKCLL